MKTQTSLAKTKPGLKTIDAKGKVLGRLAAEIVKYLTGKHKVSYSVHQDSGDFVTVENVDGIKFTGNKLVEKEYTHYSQYPGGMKRSSLAVEFEKSPSRVLRRAVARMLPRNKQRQPRMHRLTIVGEKGTKRIW
jgi:large subunit ribosomal protein L13